MLGKVRLYCGRPRFGKRAAHSQRASVYNRFRLVPGSYSLLGPQRLGKSLSGWATMTFEADTRAFFHGLQYDAGQPEQIQLGHEFLIDGAAARDM